MKVLYGAGSAAKSYLSIYDKSQDLIVSSTDGGGEIEGKSIVKFSSLDTSKISQVIIASSYAGEIGESLLALGVDIQRISVFYPDDGRVLPFKEVTNTSSGAVLYAFYDLNANPATYDVVVFVVRAELYAKLNNYSHIHYIIVPPQLKNGRPGDLGFYEFKESTFEWKCRNIVTQVMQLGVRSSGVSKLVSRKEVRLFLHSKVDVFPENYSADNPRDEHAPTLLTEDEIAELRQQDVFKTPEKATELTDQLLKSAGNKKIVTLTLREYAHQKSRNSSLLEWGKFLHSLDVSKYFVVIIRDTEKINEKRPDGWENFNFYDAAAISVALRISLYEAADINLFCSNGPASLVAYMRKARYLVFNMSAGDYECTSAVFFEKRNRLKEGERFYFWALNNYQRLVWEPDTFESVSTNFMELERDIADERH